MERKDLLAANGKIFIAQGQALDEVAQRDVKVLVVGNPANTNCLIAMKNAPSLKPTQLHRDDAARPQPRAVAGRQQDRASRSARSARSPSGATTRRRSTRTLFQAEADGKKVWPMINDQAWLENTFIPTVQKRGAAIIEARGLSSAASARPTPRSTTCATGSLGTRRRLGLDGHPVRRQLRHSRGRDLRLSRSPAEGGKYEIVKGIEISDFSRKRMDATLKELQEERDGVEASARLIGAIGNDMPDPQARSSARRSRKKSRCRSSARSTPTTRCWPSAPATARSTSRAAASPPARSAARPRHQHLDDVLTDMRRITDVCDLPLLVDVDTGFGAAPSTSRAPCSSLIKSGAGGDAHRGPGRRQALRPPARQGDRVDGGDGRPHQGRRRRAHRSATS